MSRSSADSCDVLIGAPLRASADRDHRSARCYGSPVQPPAGPLTGIRVVELAGLGPAPYACMLLAELGADVIRVDRPGRRRAASCDPAKDALNRSRPSVAVDLKSAGGPGRPAPPARRRRRAGRGSAARRPGAARRSARTTCLARNPRLVYARMTGWGQDGPLAAAGRARHQLPRAHRRAARHRARRTSRSPPLNIGADFGGGSMFLLVGILAALLERGDQRPRPGRRRRDGRRRQLADHDVLRAARRRRCGGTGGRRTCSTAGRRSTTPTRAPTAGTSRSARWSRSSTPRSLDGLGPDRRAPGRAVRRRALAGAPPAVRRGRSRPGPATSGPRSSRAPTPA